MATNLDHDSVSARRFNRVMRNGSQGQDVRALQQKLQEAGYNIGKSGADGIYGKDTKAAVTKYQQDKRIGVDGIVGSETAGKLGLKDSFDAGGTTQVGQGGTRAQKLQAAMARARELGLTITSTTGGKHAPNSYHYRGRAVDVSGPPAAMRQFYREMAQTNPTELFYDPMGGIKNGQQIGAIGGHGNHVHVAY